MADNITFSRKDTEPAKKGFFFPMLGMLLQTPFTIAMWAAIIFGGSVIYRGYAPSIIPVLPPVAGDAASYFGIAFIGMGVALASFSWFREELGFVRKITFPLGAVTFSVFMGMSNFQRIKESGLLDLLN